MAGINREYWTKLELWLLEDACLLASGEDPITYRPKPRPPQSGSVIFISSQHRDLRDFDPSSSPDWAKLYHLARAAIDAKTLPAVQTKRGLAVRPAEFLPFAQGKGITLPHWLADIASARPAGTTPDETQPSTTIVPDNAKRKAPDIFIAALIRLIAEISKRSAQKGIPFDVNEMPGIKADFRELAIKFDSRFNKAPSTFDDYLAGLLRFKQGAQETDFYQELFPELFT